MISSRFLQKDALCSNIEELQKLKSEWVSLSDELVGDNPFLDWFWIERWASEYASKDAVYVRYLKDINNNKVLIPFYYERGSLSFLGDKNFADYAGILVSKEGEELLCHSIEKIVNELKPKSIFLEPIPSNDIYFDKIISGIKRSGYCVAVEYVCDNPYVDLISGYDEYLKTRPKRFRQELRTTENHLNRMGNWNFSFAKDEKEAREIMDKLIEFHLARQSEKQGQSIFSCKKNRDFFRDLAYFPISYGEISMSAIRLDGVIISAAITITSATTMYYWIPSFNSELKIGSLGKVHIRELLRSCFNLGLKRFDFMGGNESYKYQWATESYHVSRIVAYRYAVQCRIRKCCKLLLDEVRRLKRRSRLLTQIWKYISKIKIGS